MGFSPALGDAPTGRDVGHSGADDAGRINDKLYRNGLLARWPIVLRDAPRGALPYLYSLTRYGLEVAQARQPPAVPPTREFRQLEVEKDARIRHDLHMLAWVIELHRLPPDTGEALDGTRSLALSRVLLFDERIIRAGQSTVGAARAI